jgi:hypothetical protein
MIDVRFDRNDYNLIFYNCDREGTRITFCQNRPPNQIRQSSGPNTDSEKNYHMIDCDFDNVIFLTMY